MSNTGCALSKFLILSPATHWIRLPPQRAMVPYIIIATLFGLAQPLSNESGYKKIRDLLLEEQRLQLQKTCGTETESREYMDRQYSVSIYDALRGREWFKPKRSRRALSESVQQKAAYFDGQVAVLRGNWGRSRTNRKPNNLKTQTNLPAEGFTVEAWVKPEGGQSDPCVITELRNLCYPKERKGWSIGIQTQQYFHKRHPRFYFTLESYQNQKSTTIFSHQNYNPGEWVHVVATYDGHVMKLFVNGAQVASDSTQQGKMFSSHSKSHCKELRMGGGFQDKYFRGYMEYLKIWDVALLHADVLKLTKGYVAQKKFLVLKETMVDFTKAWDWEHNGRPQMVTSDRIFENSRIALIAPPCGKTICDVPDVIKSYSQNWQFQREKKLKYRVLKMADTNGSNPLITDEEIKSQNKIVNEAFSRYNITWSLSIHEVHNSSIRNKYLMLSCLVKNIERGLCNPQCTVAGKCFHKRTCDEKKDIANGICNTECNERIYNWDGGDCCNPNATNVFKTCFDPNSPQRPYFNMIEFKEMLNLDNSDELTVYVVQMEKDIHGLASHPWDSQLYSIFGGATMSPSIYRSSRHRTTLIHEIGHILGLWHVHHGVSELECSDKCWESEASLELGDLCSDTNPTPTNYHCDDPGQITSICGQKLFTDTPYNNYMSYAEETCPNSFTEQQSARMHCYIDLKLHRWMSKKSILKNSAPNPPPLSPRIISSTKTSALIAWIPPIASKNVVTQAESICNQCTSYGRYTQYASINHNPVKSWCYYQPLGPPDAPQCKLSLKTWQTDIEDCEAEECSLTLGFSQLVVPSELKLWVTSQVFGGITLMQLQFTDDSVQNIRDVKISCEVPFTMPIKTNRTLSKIKLFVKSIKVSIDSVEVTSNHWFEGCKVCMTQPFYRVNREPAFSNGEKYEIVHGPAFIDKDVKEDRTYDYRIQTFYKPSVLSEFSPVFHYKHSKGFCGDGKIELNEQCDDGNAIEGDGCNSVCEVEKFFKCKGSPSMCYMYTSDGVCEDFEKYTDSMDCGIHTPDGFIDQWASSAKSSDNEIQIPPIPGPPNSYLCLSFDEMFMMESIMKKATKQWRKCRSIYSDDCSWVQVEFLKPVVATSIFLYLNSDGLNQFLYTTLVDVEGKEHLLSEQYQEIMLTCRINPLVIHAVQNLSEPFFLTKSVKFYFTSEGMEIAAVRLRSLKALNPVTVGSCGTKELYNVDLDKCVQYNCKKPVCAKYMTKNAQASCTGYEEGDRCTVTCNDGYTSLGKSNVVRCIDGKWDGSELICKPIDCGIPKIPHADVVCMEGTTYEKKCVFKCRPPARHLAVGDNKSKFNKQGNIMCQKTGQWSVPDTYCHLTCEQPPSLPTANLVSRKCKYIIKKKGQFDFGIKCQYRCKIGYQLIHKINSRRFKLHCGAAGQWYGPRCVAVKCADHDMKYTGLYNCTNGLMSQSLCTMSCPGQQSLSIKRCNSVGQWEGQFAACDFSKVKCPMPPNQNNLIIKCNDTAVGSTCRIKCKNKDKTAVLKKDQYPVETLMCTGSSKWMPAVKDVQCQYHCSQMFEGDEILSHNKFLKCRKMRRMQEFQHGIKKTFTFEQFYRHLREHRY